MVNPFTPFFPAEGDMFANRSREQALFREGLEQGLMPGGPGPWNAALVGPWGIGKTSLLRRFRRIVQEFDPPVLPVALTVTPAVAAPGRLTAELLKRVKEAIADTSVGARWSTSLVRELSQWEPTIGWGPVGATRRRAAEPDPDLYRELRRLWREYLNARVPGLVFFLDDANALVTRDPDALMSLRGVFQDLQGDGARYPLVITGPEDMFSAVRDASEPVTRFFERMPLGPFALEDVTDAIRGPLAAVDAPVRLSDAAIASVWSRTGGHPFFVAFAMRDVVREAFERGATEVDEAFVGDRWPSIAEHLATERFEAEWSTASPAEQNVLRTMASEPEGPLSRSIGKSGYTLLGRMVAKGLVTRTRRGDYSLYHPLFQAFVLGQDLPANE